MGWWRQLQQVSKAAIAALLGLLVVVLGLELAGRDTPSVGALSGFVLAAAVLIVYSEYSAGRDG